MEAFDAIPVCQELLVVCLTSLSVGHYYTGFCLRTENPVDSFFKFNLSAHEWIASAHHSNVPRPM